MRKMKTLAKPFEIKNVAYDGTFEGYGSVFGNEDAHGDVVMKGAFAKSLAAWNKKGKLPVMLWQHKADEPIGVYTEMREDSNGLVVKGKLLITEDPLAKRAFAHLKAGSVSGLSIGYNVPKGGGEWDDQAGVYRLKEIELWEVSLVTFPSNESAQVSGVKSAFADKRSLEIYLREAGFSKNEAKLLISGGYAGLEQREAATQSDLAKLNERLNALVGKF